MTLTKKTKTVVKLTSTNGPPWRDVATGSYLMGRVRAIRSPKDETVISWQVWSYDTQTTHVVKTLGVAKYVLEREKEKVDR